MPKLVISRRNLFNCQALGAADQQHIRNGHVLVLASKNQLLYRERLIESCNARYSSLTKSVWKKANYLCLLFYATSVCVKPHYVPAFNLTAKRC